MAATSDAPQVIVHPPIALALGLIAAFGLNWLLPLPFVSPPWPRVAIGLVLFLLGVVLAGWSVRTFRNANTQVLTNQPASTIVTNGPYGFSCNPIYVGMFLGLIGLAVGFDTLWIVAVAIALYFVIRFGWSPGRKSTSKANSAAAIAITRRGCGAGCDGERDAASRARRRTAAKSFAFTRPPGTIHEPPAATTLARLR